MIENSEDMTKNMTEKSTFLTEKSTKSCTKNSIEKYKNTTENSTEKYKKSAAEEVRKSDQKPAACVPKNSLCWNCKRACADRVHQCSWSSESKPVKGWAAEPYVIREGGKKPLPTYCVKKCPKFIKRDPFDGEIGKAIEFLCKYFDRTGITIYNNLEEYIDRWEAETGKKFPTWVIWVKRDKEWQRKGCPEW